MTFWEEINPMCPNCNIVTLRWTEFGYYCFYCGRVSIVPCEICHSSVKFPIDCCAWGKYKHLCVLCAKMCVGEPEPIDRDYWGRARV